MMPARLGPLVAAFLCGIACGCAPVHVSALSDLRAGLTECEDVAGILVGAQEVACPDHALLLDLTRLVQHRGVLKGHAALIFTRDMIACGKWGARPGCESDRTAYVRLRGDWRRVMVHELTHAVQEIEGGNDPYHRGSVWGVIDPPTFGEP